MKILKITLTTGDVINGGKFDDFASVVKKVEKCSQFFNNLFDTSNGFVPLTSIQHMELVENEKEVEQFRINAQDAKSRSKHQILLQAELDSIDKIIETAILDNNNRVEWKCSSGEIAIEELAQSLRRRCFNVVNVQMEREKLKRQEKPLGELDKTTADMLIWW